MLGPVASGRLHRASCDEDSLGGVIGMLDLYPDPSYPDPSYPDPRLPAN